MPKLNTTNLYTFEETSMLSSNNVNDDTRATSLSLSCCVLIAFQEFVNFMITSFIYYKYQLKEKNLVTLAFNGGNSQERSI